MCSAGSDLSPLTPKEASLLQILTEGEKKPAPLHAGTQGSTRGLGPGVLGVAMSREHFPSFLFFCPFLGHGPGDSFP